MSSISFHPIKGLIKPWNRLRWVRGKKTKRATEATPRQIRVGKPNHRHTAFFELP